MTTVASRTVSRIERRCASRARRLLSELRAVSCDVLSVAPTSVSVPPTKTKIRISAAAPAMSGDSPPRYSAPKIASSDAKVPAPAPPMSDDKRIAGTKSAKARRSSRAPASARRNKNAISDAATATAYPAIPWARRKGKAGVAQSSWNRHYGSYLIEHARLPLAIQHFHGGRAADSAWRSLGWGSSKSIFKRHLLQRHLRLERSMLSAFLADKVPHARSNSCRPFHEGNQRPYRQTGRLCRRITSRRRVLSAIGEPLVHATLDGPGSYRQQNLSVRTRGKSLLKFAAEAISCVIVKRGTILRC